MGKKWHSGPFWSKFSSMREKLTWQHAGNLGWCGSALMHFAGPGVILPVFALRGLRLPESVYFSGITGFVSRAAPMLFSQAS
jgi:hypothetical protein